MAEENRPARGRTRLGRWVALVGVGVGVAIATVQLALVLSAKIPTGGAAQVLRPGAGTVINAVLQWLLLVAFLAGVVVLVILSARNRRLTTLIYVLVGAVVVLHWVSVLSGGIFAIRAGELRFYFLAGMLAVVVGNCLASGLLTLPSAAELGRVAEELAGTEGAGSGGEEEQPTEAEGPPAESEEESSPDIPLA